MINTSDCHPNQLLFDDSIDPRSADHRSPGLLSAIKLTCEKAFHLIMLSPKLMVLSFLVDKHFRLFPSLSDHLYYNETAVEESPISVLIKTISSAVLKLSHVEVGELFHRGKIQEEEDEVGQTSSLHWTLITGMKCSILSARLGNDFER